MPIGNIPRSMTIVARGEVTRQASPGDHINITGVSMCMIVFMQNKWKLKVIISDC